MISLTVVKLSKCFYVQEGTNVLSLQEIWSFTVRLLVVENRDRVTESKKNPAELINSK